MEFFYNPPIKPWLDILYEDRDIMVVNKPAELLSVPGKQPILQDSILQRVQWQFPDAETAHRLDLSTSGLLLIALTKAAERDLKRQFRERQPKKSYIAQTWGVFAHKHGEITLPLICDWPNRPKQMVSFKSGKFAHTQYQVLSSTEETTRVRLTPITGRSHQLRVHMRALGHPILGDRFYAHTKALQASNRLLLHAEYLSFFHPNTEKPMQFFCEADF